MQSNFDPAEQNKSRTTANLLWRVTNDTTFAINCWTTDEH